MDEKKEDRLSALPDSILHHILSFLPSTIEVVHTCLLSKRWKDQWTQVPVLVFASAYHSDKFYKFTESVLLSYSCFKVKKFHIVYRPEYDEDSHFAAKIRFATIRNVEELILRCYNEDHMLPQFLFNYVSLVKLYTFKCVYTPQESVNWKSLKELRLRYCRLSSQAIECILSGSPQLEFLELEGCRGFDRLVLANKSLKRLILNLGEHAITALKMSCPNLEYLRVTDSPYFSDRAIKHVLARCPLLKSFELHNSYRFDKLVIASKSMRRLFLQELIVPTIELSCPNLEDLELEGVKMRDLKLHLKPSSVSATTSIFKRY